MHYWLYLFLSGFGTIAVPGHYDTLQDCLDAKAEKIEDYRDLHEADWYRAFGWCIEGGKNDTGCP